MLDEQIAEWTDVVKQASHELIAVELARRQGQLGATATVPEEETGVELDLAQIDLAALEKAERLLQTVASQIDDAGRATLALAAKLLYDVDPCRPDALAGETAPLRGMRVRMPRAAN